MGQSDQNDRINPTLEELVIQVKKEIKTLGVKRRDLILMLGKKLYESGKIRAESICEEIKNILSEEILNKEISRRDIERYCPSNWKRGQKKKNDILSSVSTSDPIPIIIDNQGQAAEEYSYPDDTNFSKEGSNDKLGIYGKEIENTTHKEFKSIANFQLSFEYETLQEHMAREYRLHQGTEKIWIHGTIDRVNCEIISFKLVRNSQIGENMKYE